MRPSVRHRPTPSHPAFMVGLLLLGAAACGPRRLAILGPLGDPGQSATDLMERSRLESPTRIDFTWELNESGSRVRGVGVARVEPPYHARLDLFYNDESVIAAALVDDDLRLSYGAPDDLLPPLELMWGTLGVFRPVPGARLVGGDRLEGERQRLMYRSDSGQEVHYEVAGTAVQAMELLEGSSVVEWVRLDNLAGERFPRSVTYRNLVDYRELKITRQTVRDSEGFDSSIWDPRQ